MPRWECRCLGICWCLRVVLAYALKCCPATAPATAHLCVLQPQLPVGHNRGRPAYPVLPHSCWAQPDRAAALAAPCSSQGELWHVSAAGRRALGCETVKCRLVGRRPVQRNVHIAPSVSCLPTLLAACYTHRWWRWPLTPARCPATTSWPSCRSAARSQRWAGAGRMPWI